MNTFIGAKHANKAAGLFFLGLGVVSAFYSATAEEPATIEDADDVAVTARVDADGATLRAARFTVSHAADSAREADFIGFDRMATIDRHRLRSSRALRLPNLGNRFDVSLEANRAGETFALHRFVAWISPEENRPRIAENTDRTDADGATVGTQSFRLSVASDGAREADIETLDAFVTDQWVARFAVPSAQGLGQFFEVELSSLGRASHAFALDRLVFWIEDRADARPPEET
jgi:hypothetical protein